MCTLGKRESGILGCMLELLRRLFVLLYFSGWMHSTSEFLCLMLEENIEGSNSISTQLLTLLHDLLVVDWVGCSFLDSIHIYLITTSTVQHHTSLGCFLLGKVCYIESKPKPEPPLGGTILFLSSCHNLPHQSSVKINTIRPPKTKSELPLGFFILGMLV